MSEPTVLKPAYDWDLNPVYNGLYEWGDKKNTKVEVFTDGSVIIYQGNQKIILDCLGFFRDVVRVFDSAIDNMSENQIKSTLLFQSLGTSRSFPDSDWK